MLDYELHREIKKRRENYRRENLSSSFYGNRSYRVYHKMWHCEGAYNPGRTLDLGVDYVINSNSLKQSGRNWWVELSNGLEELGYRRTNSDWGLYIRVRGDDTVIILVYVDDMVITSNNDKAARQAMQEIAKKWTITDLGEISTILGMKVTRDRTHRKLWLSQPAYIDKVAERFPTNKRLRVTPLPTTLDPMDDVLMEGRTPYQEVVGCLQWIAGCTRPDISYAASYLARYMVAPLTHHWELAMKVVSYLICTSTVGIELGGNPTGLEIWVDSSWGDCKDTRRSTTGYIVMLDGSPVGWISHRQATIALSTLQGEYMSASEAAREAIWLRGLLGELGMAVSGPTTLWCDNQGAIQLTKRPATHSRSKHIDIRYHHLRELVAKGDISLHYVATGEQIADILTKSLPGPQHAKLSMKAMLRRPPTQKNSSSIDEEGGYAGMVSVLSGAVGERPGNVTGGSTHLETRHKHHGRRPRRAGALGKALEQPNVEIDRDYSGEQRREGDFKRWKRGSRPAISKTPTCGAHPGVIETPTSGAHGPQRFFSNFHYSDQTCPTRNALDTSKLDEWQWIEHLDGSRELANCIDTKFTWYKRLGNHVLRSTTDLQRISRILDERSYQAASNAVLSWGSVTEWGNSAHAETNNGMHGRARSRDNKLQEHDQRYSLEGHRGRGIQENNRRVRKG